METDHSAPTDDSFPFRTRTGKIARLPEAIRDQLNRRLADGETGAEVLQWLNSLPETRAVLDKLFNGNPINKQNLADWKHGGFQDWLKEQRALLVAERIAASATALGKADAGAVNLKDNLASCLAARIAISLDSIETSEGDPEKQSRLLLSLCRALATLRADDYKRNQLEMKLEDSALRRFETKRRAKWDERKCARKDAEAQTLFDCRLESGTIPLATARDSTNLSAPTDDSAPTDHSAPTADLQPHSGHPREFSDGLPAFPSPNPSPSAPSSEGRACRADLSSSSAWAEEEAPGEGGSIPVKPGQRNDELVYRYSPPGESRMNRTAPNADDGDAAPPGGDESELTLDAARHICRLAARGTPLDLACRALNIDPDEFRRRVVECADPAFRGLYTRARATFEREVATALALEKSASRNLIAVLSRKWEGAREPGESHPAPGSGKSPRKPGEIYLPPEIFAEIERIAAERFTGRPDIETHEQFK